MGVNSPDVIAKVNQVMWMREVDRVAQSRRRAYGLRTIMRRESAKALDALAALWGFAEVVDPILKAHADGRARHLLEEAARIRALPR
jgi:hypothetical protein